jgi:hypothetical protein
MQLLQGRVDTLTGPVSDPTALVQIALMPVVLGGPRGSAFGSEFATELTIS